MKYLVILLIAAGAYLWTTPTGADMVQRLQANTYIATKIQPLVTSIRTKAMELLRRELHRALDAVIQ